MRQLARSRGGRVGRLKKSRHAARAAMPVEELSPGVYGWAGQEGVRLRQPIGSGGGGSTAPQLVEMMTEIRDKASSAQPV